YRFVITTYGALIGRPVPAHYTFAITCASGDCAAPIACGGRAGDTCGDDEFCDFSLAATCGWADAQGTCAPRPPACTGNLAPICGSADATGTCEARPQTSAANYQPVCGCNGVTYSNACNAAAAGAGVLHDGACAADNL